LDALRVSCVGFFRQQDRSIQGARNSYAGGYKVKFYRENQMEKEDVFFRVYGAAAIFIAFAIVAVSL
jgi:hypothetical protein